MRISKYSNTSPLSNLGSAFLTAAIFFSLLALNPLKVLTPYDSNRALPSIEWQNAFPELEDQQKEKRFAEANPAVPQNIPDKKNLISTKDQQAAQPQFFPTLDPDSLPKSDGKSENLKVIRAPIHSRYEKNNQQTKSPPRVEEKTFGIISKSTEKYKDLGKDGHLTPSNNLKDQSNKTIDLSINNRENNSIFINEDEVVSGESFKPRPRISLDVLKGPTLRNVRNVPQIGKVAINSRLNPFGIYIQEMLKAIETQWAELISNSFRYLQRDHFSKSITYTFTLSNNGKISDLREITEAQAISLSSELCRQAIASRAPFGEWDLEMIEEFGQSDEISITFNYY